MLKIENLVCSYGDVTAVNGVSVETGTSEMFGLIGSNGAGKTTTIMAVAGLVGVQSGRIFVNGEDITDVPAEQRINYGVALVPEGRRVFSDLSVDGNLTVGGFRLSRAARERNRERVFHIFPRLLARRRQYAGSLSGGEQQMLAIGRAIMSSPRLMLVDELSLGLMPTMVDECYRVLRALQDEGLAIFLVEQNTERVLHAADHIAVMEQGGVTWRGTGPEALKNNAVFDAYLGLDAPEKAQ